MNKICLTICLLVAFVPFLVGQFAHVDSLYLIGNGPNDRVTSILVQNDGKIIIAGSFTQFNGMPAKHICRLGLDGSLDTTFNVNLGPDGAIYDIGLVENEKIVVVGNFINFNGVKCDRIAKLNPDGSLDTVFSTNNSANSRVYNCTIDKNNRIIISGNFGIVNQKSKRRLARLNMDGSLDDSFDCGNGPQLNPSLMGTINKVLIKDNIYYVVGEFNLFDNSPRSNIVALSYFGNVIDSIDFNGGTNKEVSCIVNYNEQYILIGGYFDTIANISSRGLARIGYDGNFDSNFNIGFGINNAGVYNIGIFDSGLIAISGGFSEFNGIPGHIQVLSSLGEVQHNFASNSISGSISTMTKGPCDIFYFGGTFKSLKTFMSKAIDTDKIGRIRFDVSVDTIIQEINSCEEVYIENDTLTQSGTYIYNNYTIEGCKSVYLYDINIVTIDTTIYISENSIKAQENYNLYEWLDCNNHEILHTSTENHYQPSQSSNYAVIIHYDQCTDTTSCIQFILSDIKYLEMHLDDVTFSYLNRQVLIHSNLNYTLATLVFSNGNAQTLHIYNNIITIPSAFTNGLLYIRFHNETNSTKYYPLILID